MHDRKPFHAVTTFNKINFRFWRVHQHHVDIAITAHAQCLAGADGNNMNLVARGLFIFRQ